MPNSDGTVISEASVVLDGRRGTGVVDASVGTQRRRSSSTADEDWNRYRSTASRFAAASVVSTADEDWNDF